MRWVSKYIDALPPERRQWVELVRHFFGRFFDNEGVSAGGDSRLTLVHILALLGVPGVFYVMYLYLAYTDPRVQESPALFEQIALVHKSTLIFFTMLVIGFVAVLEWDALFPDRRDYSILTPLPLRMGRIFSAKVAALLLVLGLFTADMNLVTTFLFPAVVMTGRYQGTTFEFFRVMGAHALSMLAASVFTFLLLVALQGVLINVLSYRQFRQFSVYIQGLGVVVLLSFFFLTPMISDSIGRWRRTDSHYLHLLPPCWFLGFYETLLGKQDAVWRNLARTAGGALAIVVVVSALAYLACYFRHAQRTLESADNLAVERRRGHSLLARLADRWAVRHPLERATFYFVGTTLSRSPKHRLFFAIYVGLGFAMVFEGLAASFSRVGYGGIDRPSPVLLSIPLILSFFMLSGMRFVFSQPAELQANWVFQMTENANRKPYLDGVKKSMWAFAILPIFATLLPFYGFLWGWRPAILQLAFGVTLSGILAEILLLHFQKIPFTCSYLPAKVNLPIFIVAYWFAFSLYAYTMATLENWLLRYPIAMLVFLGLAAEVFRRVVSYRRRQVAEGFSFVFEDEREPAVQTLRLGSWAQ